MNYAQNFNELARFKKKYPQSRELTVKLVQCSGQECRLTLSSSNSQVVIIMPRELVREIQQGMVALYGREILNSKEPGLIVFSNGVSITPYLEKTKQGWQKTSSAQDLLNA